MATDKLGQEVVVGGALAYAVLQGRASALNVYRVVSVDGPWGRVKAMRVDPSTFKDTGHRASFLLSVDSRGVMLPGVPGFM